MARRFPPPWSVAIIHQALAAYAPLAFRLRYAFGTHAAQGNLPVTDFELPLRPGTLVDIGVQK